MPDDDDGQTEVIKAKIKYPCPFCGKSGAGTPLKMFDDEEQLGKHIHELHSDKVRTEPPDLPIQLIEYLDKLLLPPEKVGNGVGCTSWTLVTVNTAGLVKIDSSIVRGGNTIEQKMALEGLLMLLAENRAVMSGRAVGPGQR